MTRTEAVEVLKQLGSVYPNNTLDKEIAREQYLTELLEMNHEFATKAIRKCFHDSKFFPSIAELRYFYMQVAKDNKDSYRPQNNQDCAVCKNRGFVLFLKSGYEYAAHCTQCDRGNGYKYNGSECNDRKSDFYIPPITKYMLWGQVVDQMDERGVVNLGGEFER